MKNFAKTRLVPAIAAAALATLVFSPILQIATKAQGPQDGGGPGQMNRRPPFMGGVVTAVDMAAGTITVDSPFGNGDSQKIQTSSATKITSQVAATVSDLKQGDQVQIQGLPTGITATTLTIGQVPMPPGGGGPGGFGGPGRRGGPGGGPTQSFAMASGTVSSTSPLTISLSSSASLTLKLDPAAKITKFSAIPLSSIKVGDRIMSFGQSGDDGTLTATTVSVNIDMGGMGRRSSPGGPPPPQN